MQVLLPTGYFPPISYFAVLSQSQVSFEKHEHFVKQTLRNRCTIMGANGPLNLLVPRVKSAVRQTIFESQIHDETDWKTLHWRSLEAGYRNSPFFEYYEDELRPFFKMDHTHHFSLGLESIQITCELLQLPLEVQFTKEYEARPSSLDLRSGWDKKEYSETALCSQFPEYIQVFSDRHPFKPDMSILDLLFCLGPSSVEYLQNLKLRDF